MFVCLFFICGHKRDPNISPNKQNECYIAAVEVKRAADTHEAT